MLWESGISSKLPADQVMRIEMIMEVLDTIQQLPQDMYAFKNWNLHQLTGDYKDYWSIKVNKNYRIIFRFENRNVYDIDYLDYH